MNDLCTHLYKSHMCLGKTHRKNRDFQIYHPFPVLLHLPDNINNNRAIPTDQTTSQVISSPSLHSFTGSGCCGDNHKIDRNCAVIWNMLILEYIIWNSNDLHRTFKFFLDSKTQTQFLSFHFKAEN